MNKQMKLNWSLMLKLGFIKGCGWPTKFRRQRQRSLIEGQSLSKNESICALPANGSQDDCKRRRVGFIGKNVKECIRTLRYYVEKKISGLSTIIEPVLMIGIGIVVLIVILALYLPIFNMGNLNF